MLQTLLIAGTVAAEVVKVAWTIPAADQPYTDIASSPGDTIVFEWGTNHNVYLMPDDAAYNACNFTGATNLGDISPVEYVYTNGTEYFACEVSGHCLAGQKVTVTMKSNETEEDAPTETDETRRQGGFCGFFRSQSACDFHGCRWNDGTCEEEEPDESTINNLECREYRNKYECQGTVSPNGHPCQWIGRAFVGACVEERRGLEMLAPSYH